MPDKNWLENLKIGDLVIASSRNGDSLYNVYDVTPKQIRLYIGMSVYSYWRKNGKLVGGGEYDCDCIEYPTPDRVEEIRKANKRKKLIRTAQEFLDKPDVIPIDALEEFVRKCNP